VRKSLWLSLVNTELLLGHRSAVHSLALGLALVSMDYEKRGWFPKRSGSCPERNVTSFRAARALVTILDLCVCVCVCVCVWYQGLNSEPTP
jgi:hypothetical protein